MARYGGPRRAKAVLFTRPSMLVGPMLAPPITRGEMVEPPGIAPGSGPLITGAFIAIVRANPDRRNIGVSVPSSKGADVTGPTARGTSVGTPEGNPAMRRLYAALLTI